MAYHKIGSLNPYGRAKPGILTKAWDFLFQSKQTSFIKATDKAISYNPSGFGAVIGTRTGVDKRESGIDFATLRRIAKYDSVIAICIGIIKKEVSQAKWAIIKKEEVSAINPSQKKAAQELFDFVNYEGENLRMLLDRGTEDILTLDAGIVELIPNAKKEIVALNSVDGATIKPNINQYGEFGNPAYFQVVDGRNVAEFEKNHIMSLMANPQNDVRTFGYGKSPIENILLAIQASMNADVHNATIFTEDNIPPGFINLGNVRDDEAEAIKMMWEATSSMHKLRFIYGTEKTEYTPFKQSNRDMQFIEYLDWLTRLKLSAYGLSGIDANLFQDVNRSTAEVQQQISQSRGVKTIKHLWEEAFNRNIFRVMGWDTIEFKFLEAQTLTEKKVQAEIDKIYLELGVVTEDEIREREGLSPLKKENSQAENLLPTEEEINSGKPPVSVDETKDINKKVKYPPLY